MQKRLVMLLLGFFATALPSVASAVEYVFTSKLDRFSISRSGRTAIMDGKIVPVAPLEPADALFKSTPTEGCAGKLGRPDLTVVRTVGAKEDKRVIYLESRIVSDGTNCLEVSGLGIYRLPFHRKWFEKDSRVKIALGPKFSILKDSRKVVSFEKRDDGYVNSDPNFMTNWAFFDKFTEAIREFPIDYRVHPLAARDFSKFELKDGDRTFIFVKVGEKTWAVQFPNTPWLAASGQFGFFEDMEPRVWISPHEKTLRIIKTATATADDRLKAASAVYDSWAPDVSRVFFEVILNPGDDVEVRKGLASLLKRKPTDESFKVLLKALKTSDDLSFLSHVTRMLRARYPKGPIIEETDDNLTRDKKIEDWYIWGRSLKII